MKKLSKVLSVFLSMLVLLSVCGVQTSAISSKSTPTEMLLYYEKALKKTSSKNLIQTVETYEYWDEYDYSGLSAEQIKKIKAENPDKQNSEKHTDTDERVFWGEKYTENYIGGVSQFVSFFGIKEELDADIYTLKGASYTKNSDGSEKIVFRCERGPAETPYKCTYTVKISKSGYVTYYEEYRIGVYNEYSDDGYKYSLIQHTIEKYKLSFEKVPVKSIELSETSLEFSRGEVKKIAVTVKPDNATFNDYNFELKGDRNAFTVQKRDKGLLIFAAEGGEATLVVSSKGGDVAAECDLECQLSLLGKISRVFRSIAGNFALWILAFSLLFE